MNVKIIDFGFEKEKKRNYIKYRVSALDSKGLEKLYSDLEEEMEIDSGNLIITLYFDPEYFPLGSSEAQLRMKDFLSREEMEMNLFLSSFLQEE